MKALLLDSVHKRTDREESVSDNNIGDLQQFFPVAFDDSNVMLHKSHATQFQLSCRRGLMDTKHHAVVGVDIDKGKSNDFKSVFHRTCTAGPESTNMRSLLAWLTDVARIYGYSQQPVHVQITPGKGEVELNPVDALSPAAVEIRSVGLLAMGAVTLHLSEIYLSLYRHVQ